MDNLMSLKIKAIPENESFARSVVAAFCVHKNPSLEIVNDIKTAVSEAVTNCIVHGYNNSPGEIILDANIVEDILTVKIIDYGVGIENIEQAIGDFYTTKPTEERSGLGFTIMKSFMDSLTVESVPGHGTVVVLTKRLNNA